MMGIIVLCHGSRRKESNQLLTGYASKLQAIYNYQYVKTAFWEFAEPSLDSALLEMIKLEIKKIVIVPLFLAPGHHITKEIPLQIEDLQKKYPELTIRLADCLGVDERIADVLNSRIEEVL